MAQLPALVGLRSRSALRRLGRVAPPTRLLMALASLLLAVGCSAGPEEPTEVEDSEPIGTVSEAVVSASFVAVADDIASPTHRGKGGAAQYLCVGRTQGAEERWSAIRFDVSSIPAGSTITSASISMRYTPCTTLAPGALGCSATRTINVHLATAAWSESSANTLGSNGGPCSGAVGTAGTISASSTVSTSLSVANTSSTLTFPNTATLRSNVQGWVGNAGVNRGWVLKSPAAATGMKIFYSSEQAIFRPTLNVQYTLPNGQICSNDNDCTSGFCTNGRCCNVNVCTPLSQCHNAGVCGASGTCSNPVKTNGTTCSDPNPGNPCDVGTCQAGSCTSTPANTGAVCRAAAGECDVAENCANGSTTCPTDVKRPSGFACSSDGLPCTLDQCNGSSNLCQHPAGNAGTVCRGSAGVCDVAETCTGGSTSCPADGFQSAATQCRAASCASGPPAVGTLPANCTGSSASCPPLQTLTCASNLCEGQFCSGGCTIDSQCPTNNYCDAGVCRPKIAQGATCSTANSCASGFCVDGRCCNTACGNGSSADCQSCNQRNTLGVCTPLPAATVCRTSAGVCDVQEVCNGTATACPANGFQSASTQCRAPSCSNGTATLAANCTGSAPACPGVVTQTCPPYLCSGTGCGSSCTTDAQCATGNFCNSSGSCEPKRSNAATCSAANQCTSNFCVDGVCCNSACTGQCQACDGAVAGTCSPITGAPHGSRPACASDGTLCGGSCNGTLTTACAFPGASTECRGWDCSATNEATLRAVCNGAGACPAVQTQQCDPFVCGPTGCFGPCTSDVECLNTKYCSAGMCIDKLDNGTTCAAGNQCTSGLCVDGVCCDGLCNQQCEACDVAGSEGTCSAVSGAPHGARPACGSDGGVCGGTCNGATRFTCEYPGAGVRCRDAACENDVATVATFCNGAGSCPPEVRLDCAPFQCGGTDCAGDCSVDANCAVGQVCVAGVCRDPAPNGQACAAGDECISGQCVDGFCCNSACTGQCEACDVADSEGACTPVSGAPHGARAACAGDGSACGGSCDGVTGASCTYPNSETECRGASCTAGIATLRGTCVGTGACPGIQQQACTPFSCGATQCNGNCTTDAQCGTDEFCSAGVCRATLGPGAACTADSQCGSGFCTDGVCCLERCDGQCQSCTDPASPGACQVIVGAPRGGRPACLGFGPCASTCIGDQPDACQFPDQSTECGIGSCAEGVVTNPATCNGAGTCLPPGDGLCEPYVCDETGTSCRTDCNFASDCQAGFECQGGACVPESSSGGAGGSAGSAGTAGSSSGGTAGNGGTGASGGSGNAGGTADAGPDGGTGSPGSAEDDGCGCRTVGGNSAPGQTSLAGLLLLGGLLLRRRRLAA